MIETSVCVACTCLWLLCTHRVDYTGAHCDGSDTDIWVCWKYTELNTKEAEDLQTLPRAFRISQSDTPSHHLFWGWPVVVWKQGLQPMANCKFGEILSYIFSSSPDLITPNNIFNTVDHASAYLKKTHLILALFSFWSFVGTVGSFWNESSALYLSIFIFWELCKIEL